MAKVYCLNSFKSRYTRVIVMKRLKLFSPSRAISLFNSRGRQPIIFSTNLQNISTNIYLAIKFDEFFVPDISICVKKFHLRDFIFRESGIFLLSLSPVNSQLVSSLFFFLFFYKIKNRTNQPLYRTF